MAATSLNFSPYLSDGAADRLRQYKYRGSDHSLIYIHFWKPLCNRTVEWLPRTLAPNVITVSALALVLCSHFLVWHYCPDLKEDVPGTVPSWVWVVAAVTLFMYQYMDNLDGYQARRTGMSSPLGLVMDHGCDAINCTVGTLSLCAAINAGATWKLWLGVLSALQVFFFNSWEHYYRGEFILPVVNGPNEGILIAIGVYIITAVQGMSWWLNTVAVPLPLWAAQFEDAIFGFLPHYHLAATEVAASGYVSVQYNTLATLLMFFSFIFTTLGNTYNVWYAIQYGDGKHGRYGKSWLLTRFPFVHALTRTVPVTVMTIMANMWIGFSTVSIFQEHPRLFCWTVGFLYAKLSIHLMIAHLSCEEYHPWRKTLVPLFFLGAHVGVALYRNELEMTESDERMWLYEFFALAAVTFAHLAINATLELSDALNVRIFTVGKARKD